MVHGQAEKAIATAQKVRRVAELAGKAFVGRDEAIHMLSIATITGEHAIMVGPKGTAKSSLARFFCQNMGKSFFRRLLNPDTTREDLVGPLDPSALRDGRWERRWAGLAETDFAFLDEVGRASNQVLNMLLDVMEERRVASGNEDREIPLHLVVGATNTLISHDDTGALWDRFTFRCCVDYVTTTSHFTRMLSADGLVDGATAVEISSEELENMRRVCKKMAKNPSQAVLEAVVDLWQKSVEVVDEPISDRRWQRLLIAAAGEALYCGRTEIIVQDLRVGIWVLWSDDTEREAIVILVRDVADKEGKELRETSDMVAQLEAQALNADTLEKKSIIYTRADQTLVHKVTKHLTSKGNVAEWENLKTRLETLKNL